MSETTIHTARPEELTLATLHDILRLRVDVFVVEQACPYPELDGYDLRPNTTHRWIEGNAAGQSSDAADPATADSFDVGILSYVRMIQPTTAPSAERKLGRVVTRPAARGRGLAERLIASTLEAEAGPVICEAQSHLADWYRRFGFVVTGPDFIEDGIPHVPMRLDG